MKMPLWFQEEMMKAFHEKDVYLIVQLNRNWREYLKKVEEMVDNSNK